MKPKSTLRSFLLAGPIAALLFNQSAQAQQIYWLGTTDGNFNADNWTNVSGTAVVSSLVPANSDGLNFDTSEASFNDVAGSFTINNDLVGLTGLTLSITDNSATGDFNISGNAITIGASGISSNVLNGTGSTLAFGGTGITLDTASQFYANFGALTVNSDVDNGGNLLTVTGGGATSITGSITGLGGLDRTNSGSLTLSGTNSYGGGTTITNGTVNFTTPTTMPGAGTVTVNTGTTLGITLGGGWTTGASGNGTLGGLLAGDGGQAGGSVIFVGNVTLGLETSGNQTYTGVIGDVGTSLALRKTGSTQLELKGLNTYSGGTVVAEGQVSAPGSTAGGSISPLGAGLVTLLPGTKLFLSRSDFTNAIDATDAEVSTGNSFGTSLPSNITVTGTVALMSNNGSGNIDYTGDIDGTGGVISYGIRETNQLAVDLIGTNTFDGPATVAANANMGFVNRVSLPDTGSWTAANLKVEAGGIAYFYVGGGTQFTTADIDIISGLGTGSAGFLDGSFLGFWTSSNFTHTSVIADTNGGANKVGLAKHNGATLTLGASNTYSGPTLIRKGTIEVSSINSVVGGTASSSLGAPTTAEDGKISFCGSYAGCALKYVGTGETTDRIVVLNNYAGGQSDIILDQSGTGLLKFTGDMEYPVGGKTIRFQGNTAGEGEFSGALGGNTNAKVEKSGSGTWTISGNNIHYGVTQLTSGVLKLTTAIQDGGLAPTVNTVGGSPDIVVSDASGLEVGMTVSSERVPLGSTIVSIAGTTVTLDNNAASTANNKASGIGYPGCLGLATSDPSNLIWNNNATLQYDGPDCTTNRGFNVQTRVATLDVPTGSTTLAFTGDNDGTTGRIVKSGAGTLVLAGALVHTGSPNAVNDGTLLINGDASLMTGAVEVAALATFGGTGTIGGDLTVADTGKLTFDLSTAPGSHDKLDVGGAMTFSGASELTITSSGGATTGLYTLATDTGAGISGVVPATVNLPGGWTADAPQIVGNDLQINITSTGGGGTDYATWAAGFGGLSDPSVALDFDDGGLDSGIEYVLGGDPTDGSDDAGLAPTVSEDGSNLIFTFTRDQDSIVAGTAVTIEVGTDLATWPDSYAVPDVATAGPPVEVVDNLDGTDTVTLTVAQSPDAKKFARLNVVITP